MIGIIENHGCKREQIRRAGEKKKTNHPLVTISQETPPKAIPPLLGP